MRQTKKLFFLLIVFIFFITGSLVVQSSAFPKDPRVGTPPIDARPNSFSNNNLEASQISINEDFSSHDLNSVFYEKTTSDNKKSIWITVISSIIAFIIIFFIAFVFIKQKLGQKDKA
jgi:predicted PurR-regulated permease PerM